MCKRLGSLDALFSKQTTCIPGKIKPVEELEFPDPEDEVVPIPDELRDSTSGAAVLGSGMEQGTYLKEWNRRFKAACKVDP